MHTGSLRRWALALTFWLALHLSPLKAQIFSNDLPLQAVTTGSNPVDFEFRADGTLIAKGNYGVGSLGTGDQGDGTRMLWFPSLGAFRAGTVSTGLSIGSGPWDAPNIGAYSVAFGYNNTASAAYTTAMGDGNSASGTYSVAMGYGSVSEGRATIALGLTCTANGQGDTALGTSTTAIGGNTLAAGFYTTASGQDSISLGAYTRAYGVQSVALGTNTTASGTYSTSSGYFTTASGYATTASGYATTAASFESTAMGAFNIGGGAATTWVPTDPLFEIGNGNHGSSSNGYTPILSDALVVYKNGNATLQGTLQVAPGGDIPMYTGE